MSRVKISDVYEIQKSMMTSMGVWHVQNPTTSFKIRKVISWSVFLIAYVGMLMQIAYVLTDFVQLVQILYLTTSFTSYFCKMLGFASKRRVFLSMVAHLDEPIFVPERQGLEHHVVDAIRTSTIITKLYRMACLLVVVMLWVYPLMAGIPLLAPFPYDLGEYAPVMYVIQALALLVAAWNNFCLDSLCTSLMALAAGQFQVLKDRIIEVRKYAVTSRSKLEEEEEVDEVVAAMLKDSIRHHCAIITFVENIEMIFSFGLLTQFLGSVVVICNTGFYLLMIATDPLQHISLAIYFVTMMTQLALYCWYGNEIILKSVEINDACYMSDWYSCGARIRRLIFIVMERSKRPLSITAWKFSHVSLSAFSSIIQWSYSYFALLQRLAKKKELSS